MIASARSAVSLDEVAMALARMRMRRNVRNVGEEFVRRYMAVGASLVSPMGKMPVAAV